MSELPEAARQRLVRNLPPGLVIATSRSLDDGYRERPLSRIEPLQIATDRLQSFFLDYLRQQGQGEVLKDDDLVPAQNQLRRIVGDKPITALLAQMFIDDVIAKRRQGLLAGSVPELMLSYVVRVDTPSDPGMRRRAGLTIDGALVQKALKVLALASHRQEAEGRPLFQPLEFPLLAGGAGPGGSRWDGAGAGGAAPGAAGLPDRAAPAAQPRRRPELAALSAGPAGRLPGGAAAAGAGWRPIRPGMERCGRGSWRIWKRRSVEERERMRGFLLALRDCCSEQAARAGPWRCRPMFPIGWADWAFSIRRRSATGWRCSGPASGCGSWGCRWRANGAMRSPSWRRWRRQVPSPASSGRCERWRANGWRWRCGMAELPIEERSEAAVVLGLMGSLEAVLALERAASDPAQHSELRRAALEALGLAAKALQGEEGARQRSRIEAFLEERLRADALDLLVAGGESWGA